MKSCWSHKKGIPLDTKRHSRAACWRRIVSPPGQIIFPRDQMISLYTRMHCREIYHHRNIQSWKYFGTLKTTEYSIKNASTAQRKKNDVRKWTLLKSSTQQNIRSKMHLHLKNRDLTFTIKISWNSQSNKIPEGRTWNKEGKGIKVPEIASVELLEKDMSRQI